MADIIWADLRIETDKSKKAVTALNTEIKRTGDITKSVSNAGTTSFNQHSKAVEGAANSQRKVQSELKRTGQGVGELKAGLGQLAATMGVAFGIQQVIQFGKASVEAFIDAEKNAQLLLFSLNGNVEAQERLMNQAARLQNTTIYDDDSIQQAQTFLANQGRTEEQIMKVIDAAVELSSVTGVDLNTAVMQLDATFEGNIGKMAKLDSGFKGLTKEQLANGAAADLLIQKYGGTAKAMGDTTAGQVAKLKNQFGELQETVGGELLPVLLSLVNGLEDLSSGDIFKGLDSIGGAFEKMTMIAQLFGPIAGVTDAFKSLKGALSDFQQGNILGGIAQGYEAIANSISLGLYDAIKGRLVPGLKEGEDALSDFEKKQIAVANATDDELRAEFERLHKQTGITNESWNKFVGDIRQAQLEKVFTDLSRSLEITKEQFKELTDITDKYGISARVNSSLILDLKDATGDDLEQAFQRFNKTLKVSREDWDEYVNSVKKIKPIHEEVNTSTTNMVGPFQQLSNKVGELNSKLQDQAELYRRGTISYDDLIQFAREYRKELDKLDITNKNYADALAEVDKNGIEVTKMTPVLITGMQILTANNGLVAKSFEPVVTGINDVKDEISDLDDFINDLDAFIQFADGMAGAFGQINNSLNALFGDAEEKTKEFLELQKEAVEQGNEEMAKIYGQAAQDSASFASFQKSLLFIEMALAQAGAVAAGVQAIAKGASTGNIFDIIGGITTIATAIGTVFSSLFADLNATNIPTPPSFFDGTGDTGRGGNLDSRGGFAAILHPNEAVLTKKGNQQFPGLVDMINKGQGESAIMKFAAPILREMAAEKELSTAEQLAASMAMQFTKGDDYRMRLLLSEGNNIAKSGFGALVTELKRKSKKRGGYA